MRNCSAVGEDVAAMPIETPKSRNFFCAYLWRSLRMFSDLQIDRASMSTIREAHTNSARRPTFALVPTIRTSIDIDRHRFSR